MKTKHDFSTVINLFCYWYPIVKGKLLIYIVSYWEFLYMDLLSPSKTYQVILLNRHIMVYRFLSISISFIYNRPEILP